MQIIKECVYILKEFETSDCEKNEKEKVILLDMKLRIKSRMCVSREKDVDPSFSIVRHLVVFMSDLCLSTVSFY